MPPSNSDLYSDSIFWWYNIFFGEGRMWPTVVWPTQRAIVTPADSLHIDLREQSIRCNEMLVILWVSLFATIKVQQWNKKKRKKRKLTYAKLTQRNVKISRIIHRTHKLLQVTQVCIVSIDRTNNIAFRTTVIHISYAYSLYRSMWYWKSDISARGSRYLVIIVVRHFHLNKYKFLKSNVSELTCKNFTDSLLLRMSALCVYCRRTNIL